MTKPSTLNIGDEVRYTALFLRSTGQYTGDVPQRRGIVTALTPIGGTTFAYVDWNDIGEKMVYAGNICRLTDRRSYAD